MIIDAHVHLFPDNFFDAIWHWFDTYAWNVKYKLYTEACIERLHTAGISKAVCYNYAHKPGVASYLNEWSYTLKQAHKDLIMFGTVHPDDENPQALLKKIFETYRFSGIKLHCHVLARSPDHESFFPIYESVCRYDRVLTIHAGSGPALSGYASSTAQFSGTDRIYNFMKRFPDMKCIVPHFGADDFKGFFDLMGTFKNLWTDNTMALAGYFPEAPPVDRIITYQDRILYGTDFPNIPYDMMTEINSIRALNMGKEIEDKILFKNALRLFHERPEA